MAVMGVTSGGMLGLSDLAGSAVLLRSVTALHLHKLRHVTFGESIRTLSLHHEGL